MRQREFDMNEAMTEHSITYGNLKYYFASRNKRMQAMYEQNKNDPEGSSYLLLYASVVVDIDKNEIVKCRVPLTDIISTSKICLFA